MFRFQQRRKLLCNRKHSLFCSLSQKVYRFILDPYLFPFAITGTWEQKFPKEMTHYRNFRVNEKTNVRVPMMSNKGNYLAAADHELECDILQVGSKAFFEDLIVTRQIIYAHFCSSPTQETSACSSPCQGRSLA